MVPTRPFLSLFALDPEQHETTYSARRANDLFCISGMQPQLTNAAASSPCTNANTGADGDWFKLPDEYQLPAALGVTAFGNRHAPVISVQPTNGGSDG